MSIIQQKIIIMFIMIAVGFLCGKVGLIDPDGNKKLSKLSLWLVNPLLTFMSYQSEYSSEISKNLLITLGISVAVFAIQIAVATLTVPKKSKEYAIERLSIIFSNSGFIGIPLVESVFGKSGVIYLTMFITVFNILVWTYGVALMTGKVSFKETLKNLCTPAVISVILGLIFYFCRITIPDIIAQPLNTVGGMNTPLAMLVAGSTLAGTNLLKCLKKPRLYFLCAMRLIIIPALCCLALFKLTAVGVDPMIISIVMIATSCSSATITTMFAHTYGKNSLWASEIFAVSTLLSVVTIPAVMWFLELLGVSVA